MANTGEYARENAFDFLRLFAAVAVMVHHAVIHLDSNFLWHTPKDSFWFNGGVSLFFILSGMMVYKSAERCLVDGRPWRDFYRNRALRVMPAIYAYFIALVALLLVIGALRWSGLMTVDFGVFAASNFGLAPVYSPTQLDNFGVGVINGSLWTIPVEVSFYLVLPLLVALGLKLGFQRMLVFVLVSSAAAVAVYAAVGGPQADSMVWKLYGVTFLPFLWYFAIGIFWAKAWSRVAHSGWVAIACVITYFAIVKLAPEPDGVIASALAAIPLSYAAMWFGHHGPRFLHHFTKKIGDLSFSGYIWHMIVINLLVSWGARSWAIDGSVLILLVIVATLGIASVSWWFIEKPALARKRYTSKTSGETVSAAPGLHSPSAHSR